MTRLRIENLSVHYGTKTVLDNIAFKADAGSCWIIRGISGSGKTTLGLAIAGRIKYMGDIHIQYDENSPLPAQTLYVENWYRFTNLEGDRNFYYQQRYNRQQRRETLTIERELEVFGAIHALQRETLDKLIAAFNYSKVLDEQLFEVSSGEHKKLQLIKALWLRPQLLIIDQPYTGLDTASRKTLNHLFYTYTQAGGTLLLLGNDPELPEGDLHFATMNHGKLALGDHLPTSIKKALKPLPVFLKTSPEYTSTNLISMKDVNIHYDEKYVLRDINWEVNAGERWLLQGPNGSGKSTLLSLITADHPQAYAHDIKLFGVRRGSGESIWDIKKRIGMISPELHWYFDTTASVADSIASGFFDANGLYQPLRYSQKVQLEELLHFLDLYDVKNELLATQPLGKQRLALLGRTIIKNPQLLVLDEPCQGLDNEQTQYFNDLIDEISKNGITIIYVGHFESLLPSCLTHRLVLQEGRIVERTTTTHDAKLP